MNTEQIVDILLENKIMKERLDKFNKLIEIKKLSKKYEEILTEFLESESCQKRLKEDKNFLDSERASRVFKNYIIKNNLEEFF